MISVLRATVAGTIFEALNAGFLWVISDLSTFFNFDVRFELFKAFFKALLSIVGGVGLAGDDNEELEGLEGTGAKKIG